MAILRIVHASQLPDPGEMIRKLEAGEVPVSAALSAATSETYASGRPAAQLPQDLAGLIALLEANGKQRMALHLHDDAGLVRLEPPHLVIRPLRPLPADFARELAQTLKSLTATPWTVEVSDSEPAAPSLKQEDDAREAAAREAILSQPLVKAAFEAFPDAQLIEFDQRSKDHEVAR